MSENTSEKKSYFEANHNRFSVWGGVENNSGLRECQLGAYWAIWAHFTATNEPALISLPTGSGKTALMIALSFGFKAKRVLVITPAELLRDQTANDFKTLDILRRIGVLDRDTPNPDVQSNENKLCTKLDWQSLSCFDVITATPKTTSPAETNVCPPPQGLFDLVFLDEAHHAPAKTWAAILEEFRGTKCVLLTATPFRRDRRKIRAPLIYHYSIAKAINNHIYRPVIYHAVRAGISRSRRDNALCNMAKKVLLKEKSLGNNSKLLIRADRVAWANRLVSHYAKHGIRVKAVDYTKSWSVNQNTIQDIRENRLDGMVCVGMLGEGLDLAELKIAVLHAAPRSLPFTLQFVGRVSRLSAKQIGEAHLISVPDEVRGEMRRLHKRDANWRILIPKLADMVVGKVSELRRFSSPYLFDDLDINPLDLKPFFSAHIYSIGLSKINIDSLIDLPDDVGICFREQLSPNDPAIWVTSSEDEPPWARETGLLETRFDLHIFYFHKRTKLLFEATTSPRIGAIIRQAIAGENVSLITPDKIMGAVRKAERANYFMVGLRNALGRGPALPSYKTLMGTEVQSAIRPSEGKAFSPGHALIQLSGAETRGVATMRSRVWAIRRDNINEFKHWCDEIANEMEPSSGLPQLRFLASPRKVNKLHEQPLAVVLDERLHWANRRITTGYPGDNYVIGDVIPYAEIKYFKEGELGCEFCYHSTQPGIEFTYSPERIPTWKVADKRNLEIRLEFSDNNIFEGNLLDYLRHFPPTMVMPQGGVIIDNQYWRPNEKLVPLRKECLSAKKWTGCDIGTESGKAKVGKKNIHDWVEEKLIRESPNDVIIVKDHGPGEIADFMVIEPKMTIISFYHCKSMRGGAPSDRVKDAYEVLGQACRTSQWISKDLLNSIHSQTQAPRRSPLIKGSAAHLKELSNQFRRNEWSYRVVVVQPGFACNSLVRSTKLNPLLVSAYEWLSASSIEFAVWGS